MTAFEAYWQALHARQAAFYSTRHRFWRMRATPASNPHATRSIRALLPGAVDYD